MNDSIEQSRAACGIGGCYTALAIGGVLPVLHCGSGCSAQFTMLLGQCNGGQTAVPFEDYIIPCSAFCETDVVFGGAERFRKLIQKSIEYYNAELVIAVDGCVAEIVGDDIEEVADSFSDSKVPVIHAKLPGFQGNNVMGHSRILKAIIEQYLQPSEERNPKQVNVWGIVPFYDPMWQGTLEKLEILLKEIGLEPNIIYGYQKGLREVNNIPKAAFNLLLSPWVDLDIVKELEQRFGTPYFQYPCVPFGPEETEKFLRALQEYAHLDEAVIQQYIKREEDRYFYYINRHLSWAYSCSAVSRKFYYIGSASTAVAITRFVVHDFGLVPQKIYITDGIPESKQELVRSYLQDVRLENKDFEIIFSEDGGLAAEDMAKNQVQGSETIIFGSAWDDALARTIDAGFVPVSAPYGYCVVGQKTYLGYDGGLELFKDICNAPVNTGWSGLA